MEVIFKDHLGRDVKFSPARDIAYFWPQLVASCVSGLEKENWDESIKQLADNSNITEKDLMLVVVNFTRFCERTLDPGVQTPKQCLDAVGFFESHPAAIMIFMYRLGIVCSGAFFAGIKSSCEAGSVPPEISSLVKAGKELMEHIK